MEKVIHIDGMKCDHCQAKAQNALNSIAGVEAEVDLNSKQAIVRLQNDVADQDFKEALSKVGFEVASINDANN